MLELSWPAYDGKAVEYRRRASGNFARVLVSPALKEFLDQAPRVGDLMVLNRSGERFTDYGFRGSLFKLLRRLQKEQRVKPGLTFQGLRSTFVRAKFNAGATKIEIMAMLGDVTPKMVDQYLGTNQF